MRATCKALALRDRDVVNDNGLPYPKTGCESRGEETNFHSEKSPLDCAGERSCITREAGQVNSARISRAQMKLIKKRVKKILRVVMMRNTV